MNKAVKSHTDNLKGYLKNMIDYNASFVANHSSAKKQFSSHELLLIEIRDINNRIKLLEERKDEVKLIEMTFKSNIDARI